MDVKATPIQSDEKNGKLVLTVTIDNDPAIRARLDRGEFVTLHTGNRKSEKEIYREMRLIYRIYLGFALLIGLVGVSNMIRKDFSFFSIASVAGSAILALSTLALFIKRRHYGWKY